MSTAFTVMGPDSRTLPNKDLLAPPFLSPTTDKFKWRKQVNLLATTVKRFAKGGDKRAKGILNAIGLTIFNALDSVFASQVERAITAGLISLDLDDDEAASPANHQEVVEQIISIVAKDSPTDGIRRLVQMMRSVYNCKRKQGESTAVYARKFQSLALDYLNHCDAVAAEQDSQNFAMFLIENANIPSSVYSAVITQLVSSASTCATNPDNKIYLISKGTSQAMVTKAQNIEEILKDVDERTEQQRETTCTENAMAVKRLASAAIKSNERHEKEDRTSFRVTLDDAVNALSDIKVDDYSINDKPEAGKYPKAVGTMLGKRKNYDDNINTGQSFSRHPRNKSRIPNGEGPKAISKCRACNQPNHWYKDPECIYNVMRCIVEGKQIAPTVVAKLAPEVQAVFNKASNAKAKVEISDIVEVIGDDNANQGLNPHEPPRASKSYFR